MSTVQDSYIRGFMSKCAEYGADPSKVVKSAQLLNGVGNVLAGLFHLIPSNDDNMQTDPSALAASKSRFVRARDNFRNTGTWTRGLSKRIGGNLSGNAANVEAGKNLMRQAGNPVYR